MSDLERAKLIPVSGNNDEPDMENAIDVQFNPVTLKVNLSNTIKANESQGNSRAAQFVDKSSSTLTVELVFDTTFIVSPESRSDDDTQTGQGGGDGIEQGSDVRLQTRKIAEKFIKPVESGSEMQAPSRILFQWGSFEFVGMVKSYDETLDFFSPKGRPLRATVSLKLSEDRYQFRSNDSDAMAADQTPTLSFTGNSDAGPDQNTNPVPGGSEGAGNWRDNAMFNGIESPRLPAAASLALPSVGLGAGAGFGISGGVGVGLKADVSVGASAGIAVGAGSSAGATARAPASKTATAEAASPAFKFGNSTALGTGVPGAFHPNPNTSLKASSLQGGSLQLRAEPGVTGSGGVTVSTGDERKSGAESGPRGKAGVSVASLLKKTPDQGVGFD